MHLFSIFVHLFNVLYTCLVFCTLVQRVCMTMVSSYWLIEFLNYWFIYWFNYWFIYLSREPAATPPPHRMFHPCGHAQFLILLISLCMGFSGMQLWGRKADVSAGSIPSDAGSGFFSFFLACQHDCFMLTWLKGWGILGFFGGFPLNFLCISFILQGY